MKLGDLVRPKRHLIWLTQDDWDATGIVIRVLDGGSHRKNTSYEVLWDHQNSKMVKWHTHSTLELVK